jgi:HPt (histidine-containing phosphotransfer) domain-containing protein
MKKEQQRKKEEKQMTQRESSTFKENTVPSEFTASIFDWDGLLHRLMGDEDLAREIIDDFLKQIPDNLVAVRKALNNKDLLLVQREAHIIKGASSNIGALSMKEIAEQIEIASEKKDLVTTQSFVAKLDTHFEILKSKLTGMLPESLVL